MLALCPLIAASDTVVNAIGLGLATIIASVLVGATLSILTRWLDDTMRIAATLLVLLPWSAAEAAPQVLGLVASNGSPTPLICKGAECSAHLSAFCLQEARDAPSSGTSYAPATGGTVTLVATTADGRTLRLPGQDHLDFRSLIGFTSVRVSLQQETLAALGAVEAAVEVGPAVSLLPVTLARDPNPQTAAEVALATGPIRQAASRMFEAPGTASDAARITSLFINALPPGELETQTTRDGLWQAKAADPTITGATADGIAMAQRIYDACRGAVDSRSANSLRSCLELRHAELMGRTNHKFWESVGGS